MTQETVGSSPKAGETIKVGIIGAGAIVSSVHLPVLKNIDGVEVCWITDSNQSRSSDVASAFNLRALDQFSVSAFDSCDIALLATPVNARLPYLQTLADMRIPTLVEKPFALNFAEHTDVLQLFGVTPVGCGFMRRQYASVRAVRDLIESGVFGRLVSIRYAEGGRVKATGRASATLDRPFTEGGGVLRDLGCHGIDTIGFVTGATGYELQDVSIIWDQKTDRHVTATLKVKDFANSSAPPIPVEYCVSWLFDQANTIKLQFEAASVSVGVTPDSQFRIEARGKQFGLTSPAIGGVTSYQAFYLQWINFMLHVRGSDECDSLAKSCLWTTSVVDAIYGAGTQS